MAGGVNFEADGQGYVLRFGANELIALQERFETGSDDLDPLLKLFDAGGLRNLRTFMWGGLLECRPGITEAEAGNVMTAYGLEEAPALLKRALLVAFPSIAKAMEARREGETADPPPSAAAKRKPGAGTGSSEPGAASG